MVYDKKGVFKCSLLKKTEKGKRFEAGWALWYTQNEFIRSGKQNDSDMKMTGFCMKHIAEEQICGYWIKDIE